MARTGTAHDSVPVAIAVLAFVGAGVAAFLIGSPPRSLRGDAAAQHFLAEWRRSREATFIMDGAFTRTLPDGRQLQSTTAILQRPPNDRLIIGFGDVSGRLAGKIVRCATAPTGPSPCITGADASPYEQEVDDELDTLASYVRGDHPLYAAIDFGDTRGQRCFRLDLALALPSPPYGDHALFCFDDASGAPALTVIERPEATDRTEATSIKTTVTDADATIPADRGSLPPTPTTS
jgi:hypothetical protein